MCMYSHVHMNAYIYMYLYTCTCIDVYICIYMYMHISVREWGNQEGGRLKGRPKMEKSHLKRHELPFPRTANLNHPASAGLNH